MTYVYESHLGGIFFSEDDIDDLYCEECNDYDWLLGTVDFKKYKDNKGDK